MRDALIRLTDAFRDLTDRVEIGFHACELVGETLGVSRVGYGTIDAEQETLQVERDWTAPGVASLSGITYLRDYGSFIESLKRNEFICISDVRLDPRTRDAAEALEARSARSFVNAPVVEQGRLVAVLFANAATPREWTRAELAFFREIAARTRTAVERATANERLDEHEERLRMATEAAEVGFWDVDLVGNTLVWPPRVKAMFGLPADACVSMDDFYAGLHPEDRDATTKAFAAATDPSARALYDVEYRTVGRQDGVVRWVAAKGRGLFNESGACIRVIGTAIDVTRRRQNDARLLELTQSLEELVVQRTSELARTEEALRQSQKMEAVGQLTGGIAHDFNNLLTGIAGSLELLQIRAAQGRYAELDRYVGVAQGAAKRAAALTHRLLAFSRRQTLDPKATDVNRLVAGMEDLIRRSVGPAIVVEVVEAAGLWTTLVDPNQLENALLNLCINARDAMPDGGRLIVETANRTLDDRADFAGDLKPGSYVSMCVSDDGVGMSPDVIERAFDPFFTTKPIGLGTGLGLSMIYGFARQSGGLARIHSEVGKGTTVCVYLPRHAGGDAAAETTVVDTTTPKAREGETVLIVDDEPSVRMFIGEVMTELGYATLEAGDGAEARALLDAPGRIDLLITDVGLPGAMNGRQVADAARVTRPALKVLFVTGYAENAALGHGHLDHGMHVLTKPFELTTLARRVKELIESR